MEKSQFAQVFREHDGNYGEGLEYYYRFINQFIKIPKSISEKVNEVDPIIRTG